MASDNATKYDVFLSFRGLDTRRNIISFLYKELVQRKIQTFKDDKELESGQRISKELDRAIKESKIAVVVVSVNYTASGWCLEELVKIMDSQKKDLITVKPIFYGVNPCDVRWQINDVEEHFKKHESREDPAKVSSWRRALTDLAKLSGYCSSSSSELTDAELVDRIADEISKKLEDTSSPGHLVGNGKHMKEIKELFDLNSKEKLKVVGIWTRGWKNRWALATNVYHNFGQQFDRHCFMEDVEKIPQGGLLKHLQAELYNERENSSKQSLKNQKVLLVASNVNDLKHLDDLAEEFNRFGPGSVVVITTQDKRLFESYGIEHVYEQKRLSFKEVSAPFRSSAFKKKVWVQQDEILYTADLFNMIFGNEIFEDYIGKPALALMASFEAGLESSEPEIRKQMLEEKIKVMNKDREDKLVTTLKIKLETFVEGQTDEFINWATAEAKRLSKADFGEAMLHIIGYIYTRKAARELGKDKHYMKVPFLAEWAREKGHQVKSLGMAVSGAVSLLLLQNEVSKLNHEENKEENIQKAIEAEEEAVLQFLWKLNVVDIETTLSHVCQAVLKDPIVSKDVLRARAEGLKKLGTIFHEKSYDKNKSVGSLKHNLLKFC